MADQSVMCWFPNGELNYDSSAVDTLFFVEERVISGANGFSSVTFTYPAYTGQRLVPFLVSPFQNGDVEGYIILSCEITYSNGVPTVRVYVEYPSSSLPRADGLLTVMYSGRGT